MASWLVHDVTSLSDEDAGDGDDHQHDGSHDQRKSPSEQPGHGRKA
jgi:hypothetical protein